MIGYERDYRSRVANTRIGDMGSLIEDERVCDGHKITERSGPRLCLKKMPLLLYLCAFKCRCMSALQGAAGQIGGPWHGGEANRLEGLYRFCRGVCDIYYFLRLRLFLKAISKRYFKIPLHFSMVGGVFFTRSSRQDRDLVQPIWPTSHASCHRRFRHGRRWIPLFPPAVLNDKSIRHRYPY
jgi:hypothetical protein